MRGAAVLARLGTAALPLLLAAATAAPARQPQRYAVLVGINDYAGFGDEVGGDLLGAENDARAMRDVLVGRYGFQLDNMLMLLSLQATRAAIRGALTEWLPARVRQGDVVVFYFAGHGSLAFDADGDEADGLDETICPTDVLRNASTNDITDDELRSWLVALPSSEVIVLLDSCHSGTATRMVSGTRPRTLARDARPNRTVNTRSIGGNVADESMVDGSGIIEIAAAAPDQSAMDATFTAADGSQVNGGAFTTHLVRKLWQAPPTASYRELFVNTVAALKAERFGQDPQLSGPVNRALFMPAGSAAASAVATPVTTMAAPQPAPAAVPVAAADIVVSQVTGTEVTVLAGENRGLVAGTVLGSTAGAVLRITSVGPSTSTALATAGSVAVNDSLRITGVAVASPRLRVNAAELATPLRAALAAALAPQTEIELGGAGPGADFFLVSEGDSVRLLARDGSPRVAASATAAAVGAVIAPALRNELGIAQLAMLENPAGGFAVSIELVDGRRTFAINDEINFRIRTGRDGYLTLVDLGADGSLTVIYPNPHMDLGMLRAGQQITVPEPSQPVFSITGPPGTGVVRAFITSQKLYLGGTTGEWLVGQDGAAMALRIRDALTTPLAGAPGVRTAPAGSWSSAMVVYVVKD